VVPELPMTLPEDTLARLCDKVKGRDREIGLLNGFISSDLESLAGLVIVHGYKSVGKTYCVRSFLTEIGLNYTIVRCDECINRKILLQRCLKNFMIDSKVPSSEWGNQRIGDYGENVSSFIAGIETFVRDTGYNTPHVFVLDRLDQCMEPCNELFPAIARFKEHSRIQNVSFIIITSSDDPKEIVTDAVPHIFFAKYQESQIIEILQSSTPYQFEVDTLDQSPAKADFWKQYSKIIVDLYYPFTGPDLNLLFEICHKLWPVIIQPVLDGKYKLEEFIKIYKENQQIFTNEDVISNSSVLEYTTGKEEVSVQIENVDDLPLHSKFILIASYLASFNEPRTDLHFFSKMNMKKKKLTSSPSKVAKVKKGFLTKGDIDSRMLAPNYFDLERMLSILSVIYRAYSKTLLKSEREEILNIYEDPTISEEKKELEISKFTLSRNSDLNSQIATLFSLGLISKSANSDILGAKVRWKCNIPWSTVESLAINVNFPIQEYLNNNQYG
jgi:origin recognition complex subunit 5